MRRRLRPWPEAAADLRWELTSIDLAPGAELDHATAVRMETEGWVETARSKLGWFGQDAGIRVWFRRPRCKAPIRVKRRART